MYFRCVFLLLAVAVVRSAFPQNIRRITHRDGLSNSSILSLAQDADGYIWAGSCDGLNLWDGNSARHFRLSGNLIQEIVATDDGYLWVRTNYGVDRFDTRDRRIEMLAGFQRVYKFAARSRDEAFFLHGNKLYGYVASQGAFEPVDVRGEELNGVLCACASTATAYCGWCVRRIFVVRRWSMTPAAGLRWGSGSGCRRRTGWCSPVTTATGRSFHRPERHVVPLRHRAAAGFPDFRPAGGARTARHPFVGDQRQGRLRAGLRDERRACGSVRPIRSRGVTSCRRSTSTAAFLRC